MLLLFSSYAYMYGNEDTSQEEATNSTSTAATGVSTAPAAASQSVPVEQTIQYEPQPGTSREETPIPLPQNVVEVQLPGRNHVRVAESEPILPSNKHFAETMVPDGDNGCVEIPLSDAVASIELQQASSAENVEGAVAVERSIFSTRSNMSGDPECHMPPSPTMQTTVDDSGVAVNQFVDFATPTSVSNHRKNVMLEQQVGLTPGTLCMNTATPSGVKTPIPESWQDFDVASQTPLATGEDVPDQDDEETPPGRPCIRSSRKRAQSITNSILSMPSAEELERQVNTTEVANSNANNAVINSIDMAVKSSSSSSVCDHTASESSSFCSTCSSSTTSCTSSSGTSVADSPPHQDSLVHTDILPNAITTSF